jgi:ribosomal protein L11 methyltransferase
MNWIQIAFVVKASQTEKLTEMLELFLSQAVTSENAGKDEFYEIAFPKTPDWKEVRVTGLFDAAVDPDPIIQFVQQQLDPNASQEIPCTVSKLVDQNWERVWLDSFKPIQVGENLWICPSWREPTEANARNIILDPGLAFGTGTHATTAMCLAWLARHDFTDNTVLDYGCGSGVLAIAALFSGASHADAVDIDPLALQASQQNAERNKLENNIKTYLPSDLPEKQYDIVIANILADVIIELSVTLRQHLSLGGTLLLTGILSTQAERVISAFKNEIHFEHFSQDQWTLLVGQYKAATINTNLT